MTIGDDNAKTQNLGRIYVRLRRTRESRNLTQAQLMDKARKEDHEQAGPALPHQRAGSGRLRRRRLSTAKIQYTVRGPDLKGPREDHRSRGREAEEGAGAVDVDSSLIIGKPEIGVRIDRPRAADLGVSVADVAAASVSLVDGDKVSACTRSWEQYDVRVRAEKEYRADQVGLDMLTVPSQRLGNVPLRSVVNLERGTGRRRSTTSIASASSSSTRTSRRASRGEDRGRGGQDRQGGEATPTYTDEPTGQTREMVRVFKELRAGGSPRSSSCTSCSRRSSSHWLHRSRSSSLPLTLPFAVLSIILFRQAIDLSFDPRHPRALRRREEERDSTDRSYEPAPRSGYGAKRGDPPGEPRSSAPDPDDHGCVRGRHDAARHEPGRRRRVPTAPPPASSWAVRPCRSSSPSSPRRWPTRSSTTSAASSGASAVSAEPERAPRASNRTCTTRLTPRTRKSDRDRVSRQYAQQSVCFGPGVTVPRLKPGVGRSVVTE